MESSWPDVRLMHYRRKKETVSETIDSHFDRVDASMDPMESNVLAPGSLIRRRIDCQALHAAWSDYVLSS